MTMRLSEPARLAASVQASLEGVEEALTLEDNRAASLVVGNYDQNIAHLERRLNVVAHVNGNQIVLRGAREVVDHARRVIDSLYATVKRGRVVGTGDVDGAIEETALQRALFPDRAAPDDATPKTRENYSGFGHVTTRKKGPGQGPQCRAGFVFA